MNTPLRIGAMVDYFSAAFWLDELRSHRGAEEWVERCHDLGLTRLYFRVSIFGDYLHHTKLERRISPALAGNYQDPAKRQALCDTCDAFADFDVLAAVTAAAHARDIEVVPWITLHDEGIPGENYTFFAEKHPEFLMRDRDGNVYDRALGYGHPEVRAYRIDLVRELQGYGVDGVFLDFTRWLWKGHMKGRDVSLTDDKRICLFGYDEPVVQAYREKTGTDPYQIPNGDADWIRFRAEATSTVLLRELRRALPEFPLYAYFPPRGFFSEMLLDLPTWISDHLVDQLCVSCMSDVPEEGRVGRLFYAVANDFARQFKQMVAKHSGRCRVGTPVLTAASYGPHPDFVGVEPWSFLRPELQEEAMLSAARGGADELIFNDLSQEYNGERDLWDSLKPVFQRVLEEGRKQ